MFDRLGIERDESCESAFDVDPHPYAMNAEKMAAMLDRKTT
ncbi:hypothetical protein QFW96_16300 [Saccharopolyspora sp. TS4A08]|uniref:Uncharacterized protein n=1 Tax=Saccharopolyspora ipomoeae TaxID=3042027 RepID=A0ABT6PRX6_9PSEU|nr:hypothetical protein [Saccharopolyspora sp. TS4A08]MDI2030191.1 hypothetical protein [Saccharopolyspora sp. TS4A08]